MKKVVIFLSGLALGLLVSYLSLEYFVERDRNVLEIYSGIGLADFLLDRLEETEANDVALKCEILALVKRTLASAKQSTEELGQVRLHEPKGLISASLDSITNIEKILNSDRFTNLALLCNE